MIGNAVKVPTIGTFTKIVKIVLDTGMSTGCQYSEWLPVLEQI
jgi:hypothetical protein